MKKTAAVALFDVRADFEMGWRERKEHCRAVQAGAGSFIVITGWRCVRWQQRAREAPKLLVSRSDPRFARRAIVAGFGDSYPLGGLDPGDARNRRVDCGMLTAKTTDHRSGGNASYAAQAFIEACRRGDVHGNCF